MRTNDGRVDHPVADTQGVREEVIWES
jgi:hypothetical protein